MITTHAKIKPVLDPDFVPAVLWNRAFEQQVANDPGAHDVEIALGRKDGTVFRRSVRVLSHEGDNVALNIKYVERLVKFMLWAQGGSRIYIAGNADIACALAGIYAETGSRKFDWDIVGKGMFGEHISVIATTLEDLSRRGFVDRRNGVRRRHAPVRRAEQRQATAVHVELEARVLDSHAVHLLAKDDLPVAGAQLAACRFVECQPAAALNEQ